MTLVTSDLVFLTQAGIKTEFYDSYVKAEDTADWKMIADEEPTTLPIQKYAWLGRTAVMKQFTDETEEQSAKEFDYTLADLIYKGNLTVQRKALEDDQYGQIMRDARNLGKEPTRHWNELAYTGLALGFTTGLAYDGLSVFNSSHIDSTLSGTQSNTGGTATLNDPNLQAAEATMMSLLDDKGKPLAIMPDTLVVGPALRRRATDLCGSTVVVTHVGDGTASTGATASTNYANYFRGRYNVVVSPYLVGTYAYYWFLMDNSRGIKGVIIQNRQDVPITMETDMDQPSAKIKEKYHFTARGRYVQGYSLWQTMYGSAATA